jgi:hypothetical protein
MEKKDIYPWDLRGYTHAHNRLSKTLINNQNTFVNPYWQIILQRPVFLSSDFFLVHSYTMWIGSELHSTAFTEHLRSNKITFTSSAIFLANRLVWLAYNNCGIYSDILRQTMGKSKRGNLRTSLKRLLCSSRIQNSKNGIDSFRKLCRSYHIWYIFCHNQQLSPVPLLSVNICHKLALPSHNLKENQNHIDYISS